MKHPVLIYGGFILLLFACQTSKTPVSTSTLHRDIQNNDTAVQTFERKVYRSAYTVFNDLVHTRLDVKIDWTKKHLYGKATITLHPHFYPADSLVLNARGMDLNEVSLVGKNKEHLKLNYSYDSLLIRIRLDKTYQQDEEYTIFIDYTSKPDELAEGGSAAITRDKGLYFINADRSDPDKPRELWTQGETESNSAWFPTIENPQQRMTQEIYITVDSSYRTLSNGLLITSVNNHDGTKTDYWKQSLSATPYLTMIAAGDFAVVKDHWKNIEVNYYVEHEYEKYAMMIFGHTPEMIGFFSEKLGVPFPWEKYSQMVVRDFVSGAMENTTAVIHREAVQQNSREYLDGNFEDYICHELFHHWFGDLVTCESWANITLNEGFANYSEYLWFEHKFGRDDADYINQVNQSRYIQSSKQRDPDVVRFDYEDREEMYDGISYAKSGRILHMLRKYVGDEAFYASLHLYLEVHKFSSVEIHDLRLAFEKITGEDLNWFFNEWYLNHGKPSVKIDYSWNETDKKETVTIEQTQDLQKNPLYKIPLLVDIYHDGKTDRKKITLEKMKEDFVFPLDSKPDLVNVDAEKMLLCVKTDNKPKEDFIFQFYHAPLYLDRYEALAKTGADYQINTPESRMMMDAMNDKFWNIRNTAVKNIGELAKKDKEHTRPKLITLAQRDENSKVRAVALKALVKYYPDDSLMNIYEYALNDSSYLVMTSAFKIICDHDENKGIELAKKLEQENDPNIISAVATFYAQKGKEESNTYLISALGRTKGFDRYQLISEYSKFLIRQENPKVMQPGIEKLADLGRNASSRFIRQAAVNVLGDINKELENRVSKTGKQIDEMKTSHDSQNNIIIEESKLEKIKRQRDELKETISDIKKNEKDKRLIKAYKDN